MRADLGLKPAVPGPGPTAAAPGDRLEAIRAYRDAVDPGVEAGIQAIADIAVCIDHLAATLEAFFHDGDFEPGAGAQQLVDSAIDVLGTNYVRLRWPRLFLLLQAVALLEDIGSTYGVGSNNGVRLGRAFSTLLGFLFQPGKTLEQLDPSGRALPDYTAMVADFSVRVAAIIVSFLDRKDEIAVVRDMLTGWDGPGLDVDDPRPPTRADVDLAADDVARLRRGDTGGDGRRPPPGRGSSSPRRWCRRTRAGRRCSSPSAATPRSRSPWASAGPSPPR